MLLAMLKDVARPHLWPAFLAEHDADFAYALQGAGRFRVNCFQQENGPAAVFRMIPETVRPLESLGVPPAVERLAQLQASSSSPGPPTGRASRS